MLSRIPFVLVLLASTALAADPQVKYAPGRIDLRAKVAAWRAKKALPQPAVAPAPVKPAPPEPQPQPLLASTKVAAFLDHLSVPPLAVLIPFRPLPGQWRAHGGYTLRSLGSLRAHTSSLALASGLPSYLVPSSTGSLLGAAAGIGSRYYDDGFVSTDPITPATGTTVFFGYDNDSQVEGGEIAYHGSGTRQELSETLSLTPEADTVYLSNGIVLGAAWEAALPHSKLHAGLDFSLTLVGGSDTLDRRTFVLDQRLDTYAFQVTDRYSTGGVLLPGAPFVGAPTNLGPEISATPTRSIEEQRAGTQTVRFFDRVRDNLDVTLATLSLGPTLRYDYKGWEVRGSAGLELNLLSWEAESEQTLYAAVNGGNAKAIARWRHRRAGADILPGFYLQAGATHVISDRWSASMALRYDWSRQFRTRVGGSQLGLELSGLAAMWELSYRF
jgi:hypothetical protein